MNVTQLKDLREVFGDRFLIYVLSLNSSEGLDNFPEGFTADHLAALDLLGQVRAASFEGAVVTPEGSAWASRLGVDHFVASDGHSMGYLLRQGTGGTVAEPHDSADPVLAALCVMVPDIYPALLLPRDPSGFPMSRVLFHHPKRQSLESAILADPVLAKLFTDETETSGWTGSAYRSTGQGGTIQLWTFASAQIGSAYAAADLETGNPTEQDIIHHLGQNLITVRRAIQGKQAAVPMRIGLTGVLLPDSIDELDLGWAVLSRPSEKDREFARHAGIEALRLWPGNR